jgi:hypothetical protein
MQQRLVSLSVDAHASSGISRIPLFGLSGRTLAQRVWYGIDHLASALDAAVVDFLLKEHAL